MHKPSLFVIGAMKSGTSSLHAWLGAHPDVFMCEPKEPCYFVDPGDIDSRFIRRLELWRSEDRYLALFERAGPTKILGEASTLYTKAPRIGGVPERIAKFNNGARFIYLMRDPFERIVSHYWHMVRYYGEHRPLERAIRETPDYIDVGNYAMQLRQYFNVFPAHQILPLTFEELITDRVAVMRRIFLWLGVDPHVVTPKSSRGENFTPPEVTQVRGRGMLHRFRHSKVWNAIGPRIPKAVRRLGRSMSERTVNREREVPMHTLDWLRPIQMEQSMALRDLLGRDFPEWTSLTGRGFGTNSGRQLKPSNGIQDVCSETKPT